MSTTPITASSSFRTYRFKEIRTQLSKEQQKKIENLRQINPMQSCLQYIQVYVGIGIAIALGIYSWHPLIVFGSIIFIAGRQHSLYILNHDASHNQLFKSSKTNKLVATIFSNFVMFHHPEAWSFVQWKRIHRRHHLYLFTRRDPNYVGREMKGDTIKVLGSLALIWLCLKTGITSIFQFFVGRQDYAGLSMNSEVDKSRYNHLCCLFRFWKNDREMQTESIARLVFIIVALGVISFFQWWIPFTVFWLVPMYTVYPMILTFMDLTEHRWTDNSKELENNTRSVKTGIVEKIILSFLPRGFHREHHLCPQVAVTNLPQLGAILSEANVLSPPISLRELFDELEVEAKPQT